MDMPAGSASPSPHVCASDLSAHVHKSVCVAGVVDDASDAARVRLHDHERAPLTVVRAAGAALVLEPGMKVLVRGTVAPDLALVEAAAFPATDLGPNFDLALHYDAAKTLAQASLAHMFA